ncbi:hypothetical protein AusDCA_3128 [Desulfitobacterium sp. AusDCA]
MDSGPSQETFKNGLKKLTMSQLNGAAPLFMEVRLQE